MNSVPLLHELKKQDFLDFIGESRRFEKCANSVLQSATWFHKWTLNLVLPRLPNIVDQYILPEICECLDYRILYINAYCLKSWVLHGIPECHWFFKLPDIHDNYLPKLTVTSGFLRYYWWNVLTETLDFKKKIDKYLRISPISLVKYYISQMMSFVKYLDWDIWFLNLFSWQ